MYEMNSQIFPPDSRVRGIGKLIQSVRRHPELYDHKSKNYEDEVIKNDIWKTIEKEVGWPEIVCKTKWESLLSIYKNLRNEACQALGAGSERPGNDFLQKFKGLGFLENTAFVEIETLPSNNDDTQNNRESESERSNNEESEASECNILEAIQGAKRKHQNSVQQKKEANLLRKRLRRLDEETKTLREESTALIKELRENLSQMNDPPDPAMSLFFQSIASSVDRFTPQLRARAKGEIMNIVSQLEIQNINDQRILNSATNVSSLSTQ